MSHQPSLPDQFVAIMARIQEIDAGVDNEHPNRHTLRRLRHLAEAQIADGIRRAMDVYEVALSMKPSGKARP